MVRCVFSAMEVEMKGELMVSTQQRQSSRLHVIDGTDNVTPRLVTVV